MSLNGRMLARSSRLSAGGAWLWAGTCCGVLAPNYHRWPLSLAAMLLAHLNFSAGVTDAARDGCGLAAANAQLTLALIRSDRSDSSRPTRHDSGRACRS